MNDPVNAAGIREGATLAGKYRIDRVLGIGGMGVVVQAHHIGLDERVAIKFLLPEMLMHAEAVARFEREARAAVKIKSEHVARVSDVGTLENGAPYMVMEYLEGVDLSGWLRQQGRMPIEQAVEFLLQACEALAEAHALGIVHRDLKPANLFVIRRPDGAHSVKVLDFGISKMRGVGSSVPDVSITKTSTMMGSPLYMSPEQMQSAKDADSRADIWALGIILYELLTGASPFLADTVPELVAKILSTPPPPLRSVRPDAPEALERVILKCLEKDRRLRYESVSELAHALYAFAPRSSRLSIERISGVMRQAGLGGATALPPSSDPVEPATPAGTQASWGKTSAPRARSKVVLIAFGSVALLGAVASFLLQNPAPAPPDVPSRPATPPAATPTVTAAPPPSPSPPTLPPSAVPSVATSAPSIVAAPSASATSVRPPTRPTGAKSRPKSTPVSTATAARTVAPSTPPPAATASATRKAQGALDERK